MTPAERALWRHLKALDLPLGHFRRQAPVGRYFADFAHHGYRLIIELDGDHHGRAEGLARDAVRTDALAGQGYRVLRFPNEHVLADPRAIVETVLAEIDRSAHPVRPSGT